MAKPRILRPAGHKEDTIVEWVKQDAKHAESIEEVLLKDYIVERGQIDGFWSHVDNNREQKVTRKQMRPARFGAQP